MELIHTGDEKTEDLIRYLRLLGAGETNRETYDRFSGALKSADPFSVNAALHRVLSEAESVEAWKAPVARFLRAAAAALEALPLPDYPENHPLALLEAENGEIVRALESLQSIARGNPGSEANPQAVVIQNRLREFSLLGAHYARLQNELFPLFETAAQDHDCVALMWSIQDDVLELLKRLQSPGAAEDGAAFLKDFGTFYLTAASLVWRERRVLYPAAFRAVPERIFLPKEGRAGPISTAGGAEPCFISSTGSLTQVQLEAIFKVLPVDVSFIGADDRVKFYSDPPHRVFPRSPQIIGRLVQNCHPPKSVATVEKILASFKDGSEDSAEFWLSMKGRFIHIEYFALRDDSGAYLGTLEVSGDATAVRALEGEKRLL